jgi:hypothetical protein
MNRSSLIRKFFYICLINVALKETLQFVEAIAKLGVHYALVLTPHFYKSLMTELALEEYYTKVFSLFLWKFLKIQNVKYLSFILVYFVLF